MSRKSERPVLRVLAHYGIGVAVALGVMAAVAGAQAASVKVQPDNATMVRLAGRPATVVVGNPLYADVMVVGDKVLVQGKNYGKTNVIVLDVNGGKIAQFDVIVSGRPAEEIAVFKQGKKTTLLCAPDCNQVANTSDDTNAMRTYSERVQMRDTLIKGGLQR